MRRITPNHVFALPMSLALGLSLGLSACGEDAPPAETASTPAQSTPAAVTHANVNGARIANADTEPGSWLAHGRTYSEQRYSPLTQISAENIDELKLAWHHDFETSRGMEASPLVIDGVIYTTGTWSIVYAFDAKSGDLLWTYDPDVPREKGVHACCDVVNRGVAAWDGKIYVGALDGRLIAIDAKTGEEAWSVATFDPKDPYTITGAPRIVKGNVIIGNGGGELGVRGYITAYDAQTGAQKWRFYTVPGNPADGFENDAMKMAADTWSGEWWDVVGGGGTVWDSMAYDPELDLLYIGVGNGSPWNQAIRSPGGGDNLFLSSIVALKPETGDYVWHFQTTPGETWDYTATQHMILADMEIDGRTRKVIMQAPKNGFFYTIDRETGEFISGNNYVTINWATGLDENGRPIENPDARYDKSKSAFFTLPSPLGGHNWHPMAYSPDTNLVYIPTMDIPYLYAHDESFVKRPGRWNTGVDAKPGSFPDDLPTRKQVKAMTKGQLIAWDPVAQKEVWRVQHSTPWNGGLLATAGGLVFQGNAASEFAAYSADTGEKVWSYDVQTGVIAPPITYEVDGEQYVALMAGYGGAYPLAFPSYLADRKSMPNVSRMLVFKADGDDRLPAIDYEPVAWNAPPAQFASAEVLGHGKAKFFQFCNVCHADSAMGSGFVPDLRRSATLGESDIWADIVLNGTQKDNGMAAFGKYITAEDAEAIRAYVIERAQFAYNQIEAGLAEEAGP